MKPIHIIFPAIMVFATLVYGCGQTPEDTGPKLPQEVPNAVRPFTSESAGKPGLSIYQLNSDGSSQEVIVPGLSQETQNTMLVPDTKGMVVTSAGFNPSELTFKVGTKLIIQNSDSAPHQPSSDPHPEHTDCPELNSGKSLAQGEFYEVTLTEAKTCGMHDHLNPALKATITVTE